MRRKNNESGAILAIVIIFMFVVTITGLAFLNAGVMEYRLAMREVHKTQAFYLADGGIEHLGFKLLIGENEPQIPWTNLGEGQYKVVASYAATPPYAISTGQRLKDGELITEQKIKVTIETVPLFDYAVFGYDGALMSGSSTISGSQSKIGTNSISTAPPAIELQGGAATVEGEAHIGPGGEERLETAIDATEGQIPLSNRSALERDKPKPPVRLPYGPLPPEPWPVLFVPGGGDEFIWPLFISGPTGEFSSIEVNGQLTIDGNDFLPDKKVTLIVGTLKVGGSGRIFILNDADVRLYVTGVVLLTGNAIENASGDPRLLHIYGTESCTDITLGGTTVFYGAVYAPNATIKCTGTGNILGSVIGKKVEVKGTPQVEWDARLADPGEDSVNVLTNWQQIS